MNQKEWATKMANRYFKETGKSRVGERRLHYWIVSLPRNDRQMPSRGGKRVYENTMREYKNLSRILTDARIDGLLPWNRIVDEKNKPLRRGVKHRSGAKVSDIDMESKGSVHIFADEMYDWDKFKDSINISVSPGKFNHQSHRMLVVIEKATAERGLKRICSKYGADLLIFTGQFSATRVNDFVELARNENKPIHLFYISDLDCGGWIMPPAMFQRINEIYPNPSHKMTRVALTRSQAKARGLPKAFDPDDKKYPEGQKQRFYNESGGRACIELDALSEKDLLNILEKELKQYANLDQDRREHRELKEKIDEIEDNLDLSKFEDDYRELENEYKEIVAEVEEFRQEISDREDELWNEKRKLRSRIKSEIKERIRDRVDSKRIRSFL